jgi:hypothetical protein
LTREIFIAPRHYFFNETSISEGETFKLTVDGIDSEIVFRKDCFVRIANRDLALYYVVPLKGVRDILWDKLPEKTFTGGDVLCFDQIYRNCDVSRNEGHVPGFETKYGDCCNPYIAAGKVVGLHTGYFSRANIAVMELVSREQLMPYVVEFSKRGMPSGPFERQVDFVAMGLQGLSGSKFEDAYHEKSDFGWGVRLGEFTPESVDHIPVGYTTHYAKSTCKLRETKMFDLWPESKVFGKPHMGKAIPVCDICLSRKENCLDPDHPTVYRGPAIKRYRAFNVPGYQIDLGKVKTL